MSEDANVRPRGYREQQVIFDDKVDVDPELFKEIVDAFVMPTNEEVIKFMSPFFFYTLYYEGRSSGYF